VSVNNKFPEKKMPRVHDVRVSRLPWQVGQVNNEKGKGCSQYSTACRIPEIQETDLSVTIVENPSAPLIELFCVCVSTMRSWRLPSAPAKTSGQQRQGHLLHWGIRSRNLNNVAPTGTCMNARVLASVTSCRSGKGTWPLVGTRESTSWAGGAGGDAHRIPRQCKSRLGGATRR
jgi:hypothetical protein